MGRKSRAKRRVAIWATPTYQKKAWEVVATQMANERTLLSFVRTSLTVTVAGASLMQFFQLPVLRWIGMSMLPGGVAVLIVGLVRYNRVRTRLTKELRQNDLE